MSPCVIAVGRNAGGLRRLAATDRRVRTVRASTDRATDAAAITDAVGGDADVVIDALGPTPTAGLTMAGFDVIRPDGTIVVLGGVRQTLPIPYGELMRRRLTLRGSWMASNGTALAVWRQVQAGVLDLSALEVTTVGLDNPQAALAQPEQTTGLSYIALLPWRRPLDMKEPATPDPRRYRLRSAQQLPESTVDAGLRRWMAVPKDRAKGEDTEHAQLSRTAIGRLGRD